MATYVIEEVSETYSTWTVKNGPAAGQEMHQYDVKARDPQGDVRQFQMNRKPSSGPPQTGELDATEEPAKGDHPPKLKINYSQGSGSSQTGSQGGMSKDDYWRRREERDIEAQKRMGRSAAQDRAISFIAATGDAKDLSLDQEETVNAYLNGVVKRLTNYFDKDVTQAGESE